jgi:Putative beta barrel porin-7 (BBP7)
MRKGFLVSIFVVLFVSSLAPAQVILSDQDNATVRPSTSAEQKPMLLQTDLQTPGTPLASANCLETPAGDCCLCGPPGRFWASAEYLLWWIKDDRLPPLVTISPASSGGVIGAPGTTVLFGGSESNNPFSGGRFTLGYWLNDSQTFGIGGSFFFLGQRSEDFIASSSSFPSGSVLARPIINAVTGAETAELVPGTISISEKSRLLGAQANVICNLCCSCCSRVDFFTGFAYLELDEDLGINENLLVPAGVPVIGGTAFGVADQFGTRNFFYGWQFGTFAEYRRGGFFVDLIGSVALGDTHRDLSINGSTVITPPGGTPVTLPGGLLALPTNIGDSSNDRFSVVPQVGLNIGYQVTQHVRAFIGYTFLYWDNVIRPGEQIDRVVNLTQLPSTAGPGTLVGPARPAVLLNNSDFWAQGINFGVEIRF